MTRILFTDVLATSPPVVSLDFANGLYSGGTLASLLSVSNSTGGYVTNADGTLCLIAPNTPRVGGVGNHANLILQSQTTNVLGAAPWNANHLASETVTNAGAPDGTSTLNILTEDTASSSHGVWQTVSVSAGATVTLSGYIAAGTRQYVVLEISGLGGNYAGVVIDTVNWTATAYSAGTGINGGVTLSAPDIYGNRRASVTGSVPTQTSYFPAFGGTTSPTGAGGGFNLNYVGTSATMEVWGLQMEFGNAATTYIPTTTAAVTAVLTGPNGTGLLVEESRTNLFLQSGDISNAAWTTTSIWSVTGNAAVAPDGTTSAALVIPDNVNFAHRFRQNISVLNNTFYSTGFFVKAAGYSKFGMRCSQRTGEYATFDLQTGTVIAATTGGSIQQLANGWFRCTMIQQEIFGAGNEQFDTYVMDSGYVSGSPEAYSYAGDQTSGMYIWGGQNEVGSFPTSYIPTTTTAVTRDADAPRAAGQHESVWLLNQLTIFQDWGGSAGGILPRLFDGSAVTGPWCGIDSATDVRLFGDGTNVAVGTFSSGRGPSSPFKVAMFGDTLATAGEGYGISLNGAAVATRGFSWSIPDAAHISIGNIPAGTRAFNGYLRRMQLWDSRLSDAAVQRLSQ